jgi:Sec-independent protein secretion pathway component TatC
MTMLSPSARSKCRSRSSCWRGWSGQHREAEAFRACFVLAFIIAAVLTPPDVVSQLALAIPMVLLYEVGIWAAQIFIRHTQAPAESAEEKTAP